MKFLEKDTKLFEEVFGKTVTHNLKCMQFTFLSRLLQVNQSQQKSSNNKDEFINEGYNMLEKSYSASFNSPGLFIRLIVLIKAWKMRK